jgi:hypothetical protein
MNDGVAGINAISFMWMMFHSWKIAEVEKTHSYGTPSDNLHGCLKHSTEESLD